MKAFCNFDECHRTAWVRGYCSRHYYILLHSGQLPRKVHRKRRTLAELFHDGYIVDRDSGCWNWVAWYHKKGYAYIQTHRQKKIKASRFAYAHYFGELAETDLVLHTCDNRKCVNPDHLFLGDAGINIRDCLDKGRRPELYLGVVYKLTPSMVLTCRILFARGRHSMQNLADIYRL